MTGIDVKDTKTARKGGMNIETIVKIKTEIESTGDTAAITINININISIEKKKKKTDTEKGKAMMMK